MNDNSTEIAEIRDTEEATMSDMFTPEERSIRLKEFEEYVAQCTNIELFHEKKVINTLLTKISIIRTFVEASMINAEGITGISNSIVDTFNSVFNSDSLSDDENPNPVKDEYEEVFSAQSDDVETSMENLNNYEKFLEEASKIIEAKVEKLRVDYKFNLAEDIKATLLKNQETLAKSEDPNAPVYSKYIDEVVEELDTHSFKRMHAKVPADKRTTNLIKEFYKDEVRGLQEIMSMGFTVNFIKTFADFIIDENAYSLSIGDDEHFDSRLTKDMAITLSIIMSYQIAKICDKEIKKHNYSSLIFKYYILQILEITETDGVTKDNRTGEDGSDTPASKHRHDLYCELLEILRNYLCADEKTQFMKNRVMSLKTALERFIPIPDELEPPVENNSTGEENVSGDNSIGMPTGLPIEVITAPSIFGSYNEH